MSDRGTDSNAERGARLLARAKVLREAIEICREFGDFDAADKLRPLAGTMELAAKVEEGLAETG